MVTDRSPEATEPRTTLASGVRSSPFFGTALFDACSLGAEGSVDGCVVGRG